MSRCKRQGTFLSVATTLVTTTTTSAAANKQERKSFLLLLVKDILTRKRVKIDESFAGRCTAHILNCIAIQFVVRILGQQCDHGLMHAVLVNFPNVKSSMYHSAVLYETR